MRTRNKADTDYIHGVLQLQRKSLSGSHNRFSCKIVEAREVAYTVAD